MLSWDTRQKKRALLTLLVVWIASLAGYAVLPNAYLDDDVVANKASRTSIVPTASFPRSPYAEWVHGHWITTSVTRALDITRQYVDVHRIPVDVITLVEDFTFLDKNQRPALASLLQTLRSRKQPLRVVVSLDAIIPIEETEVIKTAKEWGFLLEQGATFEYKAADGAVIRKGCLVDFTNIKALEWFQGLIEPILRLGVDGAKNTPMDGVYAEYLNSKGVPGAMSIAETWGAAYYYSMFDFGRKVIGFDFVTMMRPVDSYGPFHFRSFGPQDISLASRVGDHHHLSFAGLKDSALHFLHSADRGYINIGMSVTSKTTSDTSGSRKSLQELFLRWTQMSALTAIMENGGLSKDHLPWEVCVDSIVTAESCVDSYRRAVNFHRSLRPYFLALGSTSFMAKVSVGEDASTNEVSASQFEFLKGNRLLSNKAPYVIRTLHSKEFLISDPDSWDYLIGSDLFVAPVLNSTAESGAPTDSKSSRRVVTFPPFGQWIAMPLSRSAEGSIFPAKTTVELDVGIDELLVFQRRGSIIPTESSIVPGGIHFVVEHPQRIRSGSLIMKHVPKYIAQAIPLAENGAPEVEFAYVYGEHDHGMVAMYTTPPVEDVKERRKFMIEWKASPFHLAIVVELRKVKPVFNEAVLADLRDNGYHLFTAKQDFVEKGVGSSGLRSIFVGESEVWLFDPFASMGNTLLLGPFEEI